MARAEHLDRFADSVIAIIKAAVAPLVAELGTLDAKTAALETLVASLRERVAVAEAREPLPGPVGPAGRDGLDGVDGADGFTCDELTVVQAVDDERLVTLSYHRGTEIKTIGTIRFSTPRYCGVYAAGRRYTKGDQVTYAGSLWHCSAATMTKPGGEASGWTLQVKRGTGS